MADEGLDREGDRWVAENVKRLREQRSWSQSELARRMVAAGVTNYNQMTVSRTEKGERTVSAGELLVLGKVLDTFAANLLQSPPARDISELTDAIQRTITAIENGITELYELQETLAFKADSFSFDKTTPPFAVVVQELVTVTPETIAGWVDEKRANEIDAERLSEERRDERGEPVPTYREYVPGSFMKARAEAYGVLDQEAP